jgi:hypothetical protein
MKALLASLLLAVVFALTIPIAAGATTFDTQQSGSHWHRWQHHHHRR